MVQASSLRVQPKIYFDPPVDGLLLQWKGPIWSSWACIGNITDLMEETERDVIKRLLVEDPACIQNFPHRDFPGVSHLAVI
jgi:hypothetical protein